MKVVMLLGNKNGDIKKRVQVVASSGNLSRANGTVTEVIKKNSSYESNLKLARIVVGYGHKSISEHDYLVFAIENVTPIVEQILISYRLTSFTIKSRRNVDFRNVGFYVPVFMDKDSNVLSNNKKLQNKYKKYMKDLFLKYGNLVDKKLPIEDARYILPYSYYSNIIMGCDANELLKITSDMLYGKISRISEVNELGKKFAMIIKENVPYLYKALENENMDCYLDKFSYLDDEFKLSSSLVKESRLVNYTNNSDEIVLSSILINRYQMDYNTSRKIIDGMDKDLKLKLMDSLKNSKNNRELEQVIFSFETSISLAVLTHITRHRMHSLLIPDFVPLWNLDNYVIPNSLKEYESKYREIFANNKKIVDEFKSYGVRDEDLVYFYLSGNSCNIFTTMNARSLCWISKMRCCNKAQWEIRKIVNKWVSDVKSVSPLIGGLLGPTCVTMGYCPEGKDSCKNRGVVIKN